MSLTSSFLLPLSSDRRALLQRRVSGLRQLKQDDRPLAEERAGVAQSCVDHRTRRREEGHESPASHSDGAGAVVSLAFHPLDPSCLASASYDRTVRTWRLKEEGNQTIAAQELYKLSGHSHWVRRRRGGG
eukprot:751982-Hanusia_phi.AAC.3